MSITYQLVFTGLNQTDLSREQKIAKLAALLKVPEAKIEKMIASTPMVIKTGIDSRSREKYQRALTAAGALCEFEAEGLELSLEPADIKTETAETVCPQCGAECSEPGLCESCTAQNSAAEKQQKKQALKQEIKDGVQSARASWTRGIAWKVGIVLVLLIIFGDKLNIGSAFFKHEKHLVYQTLPHQTICARQASGIMSTAKPAAAKVMAAFDTDFSRAEQKSLMQRWNQLACRSSFTMEVGNVGTHPIGVTRIELNTQRFVQGSLAEPQPIRYEIRNISASTRRERDPVIKQTGGTVVIENLYPETLVELSFSGWIDGKASEAGWEVMMRDIQVDQGNIDIGSPSATAFARLLTVFF